MKRFLSLFLVTVAIYSFIPVPVSRAQVFMSAGSYTQNFDILANAEGPTNFVWINNVTLPGWYAAHTTSPINVTNYYASGGGSTLSTLYSFGTSGSTERALGTIAANSEGSFAHGLRFTNDTAFVQTNVSISYTGEQWRNNGNTAVHSLTFSYRISSTPIVSPDVFNTETWTSVLALKFNSPITGSSVTPLNGNASANRVMFSNVMLTNAAILPGQEIFLRWFDFNDLNSDHALAVDDLTVTFSPIVPLSPSLEITRNGSAVEISWTTNAAGFVLQHTPTLSPTNWQPVGQSPSIDGERYIVTIDSSSGSEFYRLKQE